MRSVTRLATLLFATATLACGDTNFNNVVVPITSVAGTWNLQTIDGQPLPHQLDATDEVTAGTLTMAAATPTSGSFTLAITSQTNGQSMTNSATGNYSLSGTVLSLTSGGQTMTGSFAGGNTLTLSDEGSTLVFARQ